MADNQDNNSSESLGGLILLGILGYAAYKVFSSNSGDTDNVQKKRTLYPEHIESIVREQFRSITDDEMMVSCFSLMMPDILGIKKDHYNDMLLRRLKSINMSILSMINSGFEAHNPNLGDEQFNDLLSFIRTDCYNDIKATKFFCQLEGKFLSLMPGFKLVGKIKNANIDYKVIQAISKGLTTYFTFIYVYGQSIDEAKHQLKDSYVSTFYDSIE